MERESPATGFITVGAGFLVIVLAAIYLAARVGFQTSVLSVVKVAALALFFVSLPDAWSRVAGRLGWDNWLALPGVASIIGICLATLGGVAARWTNGAHWLFAVTGPVMFAAAIYRCVRAAFGETLWLLSMASIFGLWVASFAWGYGYMNPLFLESLAAHTAPKTVVDTLFHTSIANMLSVHGYPSTGLDGVVPLRYHVGSHWLFVQLARLLNLSLFDFYQLGFPILMLPLLFAGLSWLGAALRKPSLEAGDHGAGVPGWPYWLLFFAVVIGVLPIDAQSDLAIGWWRPISESYTVSLILAFGLLSAVAWLWRSGEWERPGERVSNAILLLLILPPLVSVCGMVKSSTMFVLVVAASYAYLRLQLYRDKTWRMAIPLVVLLSLVATWLLRIPGFARPSPLHFVLTYVRTGWRPLWLAGYFMWVWIFVTVRLKSLGVATLGDLGARLRARKLVDLELLVVVSIAGSVPGFLVAIGGQSTGYFSDPQRWFAAAFLLAYLADWSGAGSGRIWTRPFGELRLTRLATLTVLALCVGVLGANAFVTLKQFLKSNLSTRKELFAARSWRAAVPAEEEAARLLAANPEYQLLLALRKLDALPEVEKKEAALFVPQSNQRFWRMLPECLAPSFMGPALSGLAMIGGLPNAECEGQRLGYWTYRLRAGGWGSRPDETNVCARASAAGFRRVYTFDISASGALRSKVDECVDKGDR